MLSGWSCLSPLTFNKDRKSGRTALHLAAEEANLELIRLFLELPSCLSFVNAKVPFESFNNFTRVGVTFFTPFSSFRAVLMKVPLPDGHHVCLFVSGLQWKHCPPRCCQPAVSGDAVGRSPPVDEEGSGPKYSELGERAARAFGSWWPCGRTGEGDRRDRQSFQTLGLKHKGRWDRSGCRCSSGRFYQCVCLSVLRESVSVGVSRRVPGT